MSDRLPAYDELPYKPGNPPRCAWGLWGDDDQVGAINLLTPERVRAGSRLVRKVPTFPLNWELEKPFPPLFFRQTLRHTITNRRSNGHDNIYDNFNTQSSTQWDGLTHVGHPEHGYYNGVSNEHITGELKLVGQHEIPRIGHVAHEGVIPRCDRIAGGEAFIVVHAFVPIVKPVHHRY